MKTLQVDGLTERITIAKKQQPVRGVATSEVYFDGWAQIRPFVYREADEGGVQASETRYMIIIHNLKLPLSRGDIITWKTHDDLILYVDDFAHCSLRDVYRSIRATATTA